MSPAFDRIAVLACLLIAGCGPAYHDRASYPFKEGEIVEFVVSGQRGQILFLNKCPSEWPMPRCSYDVRVVANQAKTNVRLLGSDDPIDNYAPAKVEYVRGFELRKIQ